MARGLRSRTEPGDAEGASSGSLAEVTSQWFPAEAKAHVQPGVGVPTTEGLLQALRDVQTLSTDGHVYLPREDGLQEDCPGWGR